MTASNLGDVTKPGLRNCTEDDTVLVEFGAAAEASGGHLQKEGMWREGITIAVPCDSCQSTTSSFGYP